ncbi:MAG: NTP transferase domain-containing protein [Halobacteriota archaeon]
MAGGKGERLGLGGVEKPLLEFKGRPLIEHVFAALNKSQIERVVTVTSPRTPCTTRWAREARIQVVKAPGQGYIQDYAWASNRLGLQGPVLIIAADLPLIDYRLIDRIIQSRANAESSALGVYLPYEFCDEANVTPDLAFAADAKLLVPTGINIVDASHLDQSQKEQMFIIRDESLLYNINRRSDLSRLIRRASPVGDRK